MATAGSRNSATVCEASTSSTQKEAEVQQENTLKLKLQKAKKDDKKIKWTEDTVDNEGNI